MNRIALILLFLLALPLAAQDIPPAPYVIQVIPYNMKDCPGTTAGDPPCLKLIPSIPNISTQPEFVTPYFIAIGRPRGPKNVFHGGKVGVGGDILWVATEDERASVVHAFGGLMPGECVVTPPPTPAPVPAPTPQPSSSYPNYGVWSFLAQPSNDGLKELGVQVGDVVWTAVKNPQDPILRVDWWTVMRAGDTPSKPDGLVPKQTGAVQ